MSLQELDNELQGGSRQNRFRLTISLPTSVGGNATKLQILCNSTTVPGYTRGAITINRLGKTGRIAGDAVSTETFPATMQVPKDAQVVYTTFSNWFKLPDTTNDYKSEVLFEQLDIQNNVTYTWKATGVWVSTLPDISFDQTAQDTIQTFDVTFTIDTIDVA